MLQKVSIKVFQFFSHLEAKHYLEFSVWGIKIKRKIVIAPTIPFDSARNRNANLSEQQKKADGKPDRYFCDDSAYSKVRGKCLPPSYGSPTQEVPSPENAPVHHDTIWCRGV